MGEYRFIYSELQFIHGVKSLLWWWNRIAVAREPILLSSNLGEFWG